MEVLRGSRQSVFLARPLNPRSESACFTFLGLVDRRGSENYIFFFLVGGTEHVKAVPTILLTPDRPASCFSGV